MGEDFFIVLQVMKKYVYNDDFIIQFIIEKALQ